MPKDFDMIIRINTDRAEVEVEQHSKKGVVTRKNISPESLSNCILTSRVDDESHSTGLLPEGCWRRNLSIISSVIRNSMRISPTMKQST